MVADWQVMTLDEAIHINPQRPLPKGTAAPFIAMEDIVPSQRLAEVKQTREYEGAGSRFMNGDTLFARITPCLENGKTAFISQLPQGAVGHGSTEFIVMSGKENLSDNLFVYYLARDPNFRSYSIQQMEGTSGRQRVPVSAISKLIIELPPLPEQRTIAAILGVLDDKIELNRRMNRTLEAIAQALFKSWFVDFEPFRNNAMKESPMGNIPNGWRVGTFGDIVAEKRERIGQRQAVVLSAVSTGNLVPSDEHFTKRVYSKSISKYLCVEQWDFAYNPSRINIGSIGMLEDAILGAVSPVYVVFRPQNNYRWFVKFSLRQKRVTEWVNTLASGSVRQSLRFKDFATIPCVIPEVKTIRTFTVLWDALANKIRKNEETSITLTSIREVLLPKLLSGEIRVKDAEKFIKEAIT